MGGVDGYSCSVEAPKAECTDFLNYIAQTDVPGGVLQGVPRAAGQQRGAGCGHRAVPEAVLEAYNKAPYVSQWLDTLYGQNVGNALNTAW